MNVFQVVQEMPPVESMCLGLWVQCLEVQKTTAMHSVERLVTISTEICRFSEAETGGKRSQPVYNMITYQGEGVLTGFVVIESGVSLRDRAKTSILFGYVYYSKT